MPVERQIRQPLADTIVKAQLTGLDQGQRGGAVEGLGYAGNPHRVLRVRLRWKSQCPHPGGMDSE